jgi:hypothetical protein
MEARPSCAYGIRAEQTSLEAEHTNGWQCTVVAEADMDGETRTLACDCRSIRGASLLPHKVEALAAAIVGARDAQQHLAIL